MSIILYYSKFCKDSVKLLNLIKSFDNFVLICIDNIDISKIPDYITHTPMIIYNNRVYNPVESYKLILQLNSKLDKAIKYEQKQISDSYKKVDIDKPYNQQYYFVG